jgi:RluA family pseudouridine synthase
MTGSVLDPTEDGGHFEVSREHHGKSLLDFLDALAGPLDRRLVGAAARAGSFQLNGEPAGPAVTLRRGDLVVSTVPLDTLSRAVQEDLILLYEDDDGLLVASKPSGLPFDASRAGSGRSAIERLTALSPEGGRPRPGHRLDKDTSGLVITTRNKEAERRLAAAFKAGEARVEYLAVIRRAPPGDSGEIEMALGKRRKSDARMIADQKHGSQPSLTHWQSEERLRGFSVLKLWASGSGRSHQIRAHLSLSGFPILCDRLYGEDDRLLLSQLKLGYRRKRGSPERPILSRPALHAARFQWGEKILEAPLPDDLSIFLAQLRRHCALSTAES